MSANTTFDAGSHLRSLRARVSSFARVRATARRIVQHPWFDPFIVGVIVLNAITLGLETSPTLVARIGALITKFDILALTIYVGELALRMLANGRRFWRDPWSWFDMIIVGSSLLPQSGNLSILRSLRIIRALRLVSVLPSIRRVVEGLLFAIPSMASISILLVLINYVFAVMTTKLFGEQFPELFGTLGASLFTLFQVMTLEGWAMEVVRPVMAVFPWAWLIFLPYIFIVVFAVLNLFIGIIVDAMQQQSDDTKEAVIEVTKTEYHHLMAEIGALRRDVANLAPGTGKAPHSDH